MKVLQAKPITKKVQLDVLDKKLLFELSQNCRTPFNQIGHKIGLSRDAVRYRINRLKENNVIQGYRTVVDPTRIGFMNAHIFLQLNQPTEKDEKVLIEKFETYPFARAVIKFNGKLDFEFALIAKDMADLENIVSKIIEDCGKYLLDYTILFVTKSLATKSVPDNFFKSPGQEIRTVKYEEYEKPNLDDTDYKILGIIADEADLPLYQIAEKTGVSADTAKYRIKQMTKSGIIKGFIPVINYNIIDYSVYTILLNISNFSHEKEAKLQEFIRGNKDILWGVKTIGKYNVELYVCTSNPDDLTKTTAELRSHFTESIRDYETLINYEEYRYTYFPESAMPE